MGGTAGSAGEPGAVVRRPIRFATGAGRLRDKDRLLAAARRAEECGYSCFGMADHFMMPLAPLIALQAVADATTTIRLGQVVLAEPFRHPAVLAKELATLDLLSGGRVEIGIGAGWMASEFEQAGIGFEPASVRIARLEETVHILKGLMADEPFTFAGDHYRIDNLDGTPKPLQRPHPPILIGGGGKHILSMAARCADIVQVLPGVNRTGGGALPPTALTAAAYREKLGWIRQAAGERFGDIELSALLMSLTVTDDRAAAEAEFLARFADRSAGEDGPPVPSDEELLASPVVAIGSLDEVCEKLVHTRDTYGISYFGAPIGVRPDSLAPVIDALSGR